MLVIKIANWFASGQLGFLTLGATVKTTGLPVSYVTPMKSVFLKAQSGSKKSALFTKSSVWNWFWFKPISMGIAKHEICNTKVIFSCQLDVTKQLFCAWASAKIWTLDFLCVMLSGLVRICKMRNLWKEIHVCLLNVIHCSYQLTYSLSWNLNGPGGKIWNDNDQAVVEGLSSHLLN